MSTDVRIESKYRRIRDFVQEQITLRERQARNENDNPSGYWSFFSRVCSYVRGLSDADMELIRYHTWHLTADNYQTYFFGLQPSELINEYLSLSDVLGGYKPSEAKNGIGWHTEYGMISHDLLRYMRVMSDLKNSNVLSASGHQKFLEIGGGYGGLARLMLGLNANISYVILDLEEILFFSAVYLIQALGEQNVELVTPELVSRLELQPGKVYLVPQHCKKALATLQFDIAANQQSMQEMTKEQVEDYCNLLQGSTKFFYSCNRDQHSDNIAKSKKIIEQLNQYLMSRFELLWDSQSANSPQAAFQKHMMAPLPKDEPTLLKRLAGRLLKRQMSTRAPEACVAQPNYVQMVTDYTIRRMLFKC